MSIRAAIITAAKKPLIIRDFSEPDLAPGAALMRTTYSEVCGTDVHLFHGKLAGVPYPIIPGHVSVGVLEKIRGTIHDVDGKPFKEGDTAAFLDVHETCGSCWYCLVAKASTRCPSRKVYGITYSANDGLLGGWSEKIWIKPGVKLIRLPRDLDPLTYIGGGCGLNTALHAVDRAKIKLGDVVAVLGVGPVGQSVIAFTKLSGANEVFAIGAPDDRLEFAKKMGATQTLNLKLSSAERAAWVRDKTSGRGADIVLEAAGDPRAVTDALDMVRDNGRVVICGQYTDNGAVEINPHLQINKKHVEIRGCWGSDFSHFYRAIDLMSLHHHHIPWKEMITKQYSLADASDALAAVEKREVVKAVIVPS